MSVLLFLIALCAICDRAGLWGSRQDRRAQVRLLLRLAANPLAKERWAAPEDYASTRAKGEKLHRFTIRQRDRSQVEADPPAGLERFVEQVLEHNEVLLGDRPGEPKKDVAWSLESGFDSQHGRGELNNRASESWRVFGIPKPGNHGRP
jgi:hypothetical protein